MNMAWFKARGPLLDLEQIQRRDRLSSPAPLDDCPLEQQRLVVLDLETSGLDTRRDVVLSIGAVVIDQGAIDLGEQFERTLRRPDQELSESVLIHGIAPSELASGCEPAEALLDFMEFVGDSPILAFHAGFDQRMLARALKTSLGYKLRHPFMDVAEIAPMLCPDNRPSRNGLDDWTRHFRLQVLQRHHASADALVTAEIALILFSRARRQGVNSMKALNLRLANWRKRQQARLM
ncbi:3'-5' exonuclease [Stutzerimonas nitrititolerans]|uniref:DNA-directed DNA polymerase n=1 Tax=Stutzerimonas nitrititolerans TaxID=2482751 RepID=A0ABX9V933_9GAMM|nr:3'-5' exonuclease [Stutzerimonas nitrititolerans]AFN76467.1 DNA polymerase III subunit epsilon [Stutzerimonas stutzeri DSM 10701]KRW72565.1 DNA polymerase III subunit epsilon [Pseudomonas sp. TTU2014-066ASC]WAD24908.1 3'-5' exonuclease [Pseudomonadaceae bacterium T75]SUD83074.1 DNA polymerase III subunit epsilon [Stutzerimonas stutzeri]HAQ73926.1 3'-5' exonuclease [Pseudomonas sp.]